MENKVYLFNTLTRKVENLIPNVEGKINMYTCVQQCTTLHTSEIYVATSWRTF